MASYPAVDYLETEIHDHGEAHARFEEHDSAVEIRPATCTFDYSREIIRVEGTSHAPLRFHMDSLVSWELPTNAFH